MKIGYRDPMVHLPAAALSEISGLGAASPLKWAQLNWWKRRALNAEAQANGQTPPYPNLPANINTFRAGTPPASVTDAQIDSAVTTWKQRWQKAQTTVNQNKQRADALTAQAVARQNAISAESAAYFNPIAAAAVVQGRGDDGAAYTPGNDDGVTPVAQVVEVRRTDAPPESVAVQTAGGKVRIVGTARFGYEDPAVLGIPPGMSGARGLRGDDDGLGSWLSSIFHKVTGAKLSTVTGAALNEVPVVGGLVNGIINGPGTSNVRTPPPPTRPANTATAAPSGISPVVLIGGAALALFALGKKR